MSDLGDKKILFIGAGNMALPMIIGALNQPDIKPGNVTVICGESPGKDKAALLAELQKAGLSLPEGNIVSRREVKQDSALQGRTYDVVVYGAKPRDAGEILEADKRLFAPDVTLLSIAGGLPVEFYKPFVGEGGGVVRAMPHLPKTVVGVYAEDSERLNLVQPLLQGIGAWQVVLEDEDAMHAYSAHAGSGPAFVAQYVLDMEMAGKREAAIASLRAAAEGKVVPHEETKAFYDRWLETIAEMGGMSADDVKRALDATILGTLELLEEGEPPERLIERVRSPKGLTNVGLIVLGNPPPMEEKHGTPEQHERQRELARLYERLPIEDKIGAALIATERRSRALAEGDQHLASNPLGSAAQKIGGFNDFVSAIVDAVVLPSGNGRA